MVNSTQIGVNGTHWQLLDHDNPFGYGKTGQTFACMGLECQQKLGVLPSPTFRRLGVENHIGHRALTPDGVRAPYDGHF
jgi:hypothetical protein